MLLDLSRMCRCVFHAVPWLHIGSLMRPPRCRPRRTAGLLLPCQHFSGKILVTPYSMVCMGLVSFKSRANAILFVWLLAPFSSPTVFISLPSFYGLVLYGWILRTDRVLIALSQPIALSTFFKCNNTYNNTNNNNYYYHNNKWGTKRAKSRTASSSGLPTSRVTTSQKGSDWNNILHLL